MAAGKTYVTGLGYVDIHQNKVAVLTDLTKWQSWVDIDTKFSQGEYGVLSFQLKSLPSWVGSYIDNLLKHVDGILSSKGVRTWRKSTYTQSNNTLEVYFITGLAPLVIIGIVILSAIAIGVIAWAVINSITAYKVSSIAANTDSVIKKQIVDATLSTIDQLPVEDRLPALLNVAKEQAATDIFPTGDSATTSTTKMVIIAVAAVAAVVLGVLVWKR